jgi:hypothetical protein
MEPGSSWSHQATGLDNEVIRLPARGIGFGSQRKQPRGPGCSRDQTAFCCTSRETTLSWRNLEVAWIRTFVCTWCRGVEVTNTWSCNAVIILPRIWIACSLTTRTIFSVLPLPFTKMAVSHLRCFITSQTIDLPLCKWASRSMSSSVQSHKVGKMYTSGWKLMAATWMIAQEINTQ